MTVSITEFVQIDGEKIIFRCGDMFQTIIEFQKQTFENKLRKQTQI